MLALRTTDDELFDLTADTSIDVTGSNPAFDPDVVARFFSFPFQVPATPHNLRLMRHANRLDVQRRSRDNDVELWFAGAPLKEGHLRVNSNTATRLECVFGNRDRELLDRLQEIKIRDLMPTVNLDTFTVATYEPPSVFGSGGMITVRLAGNVPTELNDLSGLALFSGPTYDNGVTIWVYDTFDPPTDFVLEAHGIVIAENYVGQGAPIAGAAYAALLNSILNGQENVKWYLNYLYDTPDTMLAFPTVRHENLYGDDNPMYDNYVNWWRDGAYKWNAPSEDKGWATTHVPYVRIKYIFDQIADALALAWSGDLYDGDDFGQLCLFSNYTLDNPQQITEASVLKWMNDYITTLDVAKCVPDWTAADFLKKVCDLFGHYLQQQKNTLFLKKRIGQLAVAENFKYILTEFKMTRLEEKGVRLAFRTDDSDDLPPLDAYVVGAGGRRMEIELSPLQDKTIDEATWAWRMAAYADKGQRPASGDATSSATARVFFDRGVQDDSTNAPYRMSSHLNTDHAGDPIGNISLELAGDAGLYENYWRGWAELEDKEPLEMRAVMPVGEVRRILRWERPLIRFYHPLGETQAMVKEIQFDVRADDVEQIVVKLKMLKL